MNVLAAAKSELRETWSAWDRFWFSPLHPASLGCLRIVAGCMLVYTHLVWGLALGAFFGPDGWQDPLLVATFQKDGAALSLWWLVPPAWLWPFHCACLAVLVCFTLGLWTRLTSILSALIVISYANRVPLATFGLDQINGLLAMYLAIGPCGACFSVDALRRRYRQAMAKMRGEQFVGSVAVSPSSTAQLATRMVQVHMCIMYLAAGLAKLKGEAWWDGNAIWLGAANFEYQSGDLTWLAWHPWIANFLTHATVFWETTFCIFVWRPKLRPLVLLSGILMHLGIGAFLGMWTFGLVMIITYVAFVPPEMVLAAQRQLFAGQPQPDRVIEFGPAWPSRWLAAWRCALSWGETPALRQRATVSPQPRPAESPLLPGEWWRALRARPPASWPFAPLARNDQVCPRHILVMSSRIALLSKLQQLLGSEECFCRTAADVPSACAAMSTLSCQCLILCVHHPEELEEVRALREMCIAAGAQAPVTIAAINKDLIDQIDWKPSIDHRLITPPFSVDELQAEVRAAWAHRAGRRTTVTPSQPANPSAPVSRPKPVRAAASRPMSLQRITRR